MGFLSRVEAKVQTVSFQIDPVLKFIPRLVIGLVFIPTGWAKLQNLAPTIEYFGSIGIPLSSIFAPLVAFSEVIFGIFILVGFYTRLSSIPLFFIMCMAILTAHKTEVTSLHSLTELTPSLYAVILLCIFALGSGTIALEQLLFRKK